MHSARWVAARPPVAAESARYSLWRSGALGAKQRSRRHSPPSNPRMHGLGTSARGRRALEAVHSRRSRALDEGERANGPACTPGSVRGPEPRGRSSLSTTRCRAVLAVYPRTQRAASTSSVCPCSGRGLPSRPRHRGPWWSLTPPFHPYRGLPRRSVFCGTVSRITPGGCYPPPCPVEPGRSSARKKTLVTRPSSRPTRAASLAADASKPRASQARLLRPPGRGESSRDGPSTSWPRHPLSRSAPAGSIRSSPAARR